MAISKTKTGEPDDVRYNEARLGDWRDRLNAIVEEQLKHGISYRKLAAKARTANGQTLAHTTLMNAVLGNANVTIGTLIAICDALGIDALRVLAGRNILDTDLPKEVTISLGAKAHILRIVPADEANKTEVPPGTVVQVKDITTAPEDAHLALRVMDESMEPDLSPGDVAFATDREPSNGDIVVALIEGQRATTLRRWRTRGDKIELAASDESYGKQTLAAGRVRVLGVVSAVFRPL